MRQKLTWIIPGILVTLLLGLLWAMPAFGASAGTIEFLNAKGGSSVSHVSLNGDASGTNGFWFQITDSDLDKIVHVKYKPSTGDVPENPNPVQAGAPEGTSWYDLQNLDSNAGVDSRDIKAYSSLGADGEIGGNDGDVTFSSGVSFNSALGTVTVPDNTLAIEYKIKTTEIIGARKGTTQKRSYTAETRADITSAAGTALSLDDANMRTGLTPARLALVDSGDSNPKDGTTATWLDLVESSIPTIRDQVFVAVATDLNGDGDTNDAGESAQEIANSKVSDYINERLQFSAVNVRNVPDDPSTDDVDESKDNGSETPGLVVKAAAAAVQTQSTTDDEDRYVVNSVTVSVSNKVDSSGTVTVKVGQSPTDNTPANNATATADVELTVSYVGTASVAYKQGLVGDYKNRANDRMVTVDSQGAGASSPISVVLQETGSTTGVFGASIKICSAGVDVGCTIASQMNESNGDAFIENPTATTRQVMLPVNAAGDTITVSYRDGDPATTRTATISLDGVSPALSNFSPASGAAGADDEPEISFDAVDADSGISAFNKSKKSPNDSIQAVVALYGTDGVRFAGPKTFKREHLSDDDAITGGFSVSFEIEEGASTDDNLALSNGNRSQYEIRWWAVAMDQAGNTGVSDSKEVGSLSGTVAVTKDKATVTGTKTKFMSEIKVGEYIDVVGQVREVQRITNDTSLTVTENFGESTTSAVATTGTCYPEKFRLDLTDMAGCDANTIRVDTQRPSMTGAVTGTILGDDNKPQANKSRTSIQVTFDEALDCDSVSADDFTVDGAAPNDATCHGSSVYLSVDEMDRNATPKVVLVGSVMDKAGNVLDSDDAAASRTQTAKDGIGAMLTVTVTGTGAGDRPVTDKRITVTVSSDERSAASPAVSIRKVGEDYKLGTAVSGTAVPTGTTNEWAFARNFTSPGLYNVYVTMSNLGGVSDSTSGLSGKKKDKDGNAIADALSADELKSSKAILFEVDNEVQDPTWPKAITANGNKTDNPDVFISATFTDEGKEYGLAAMCEKSGETDMAPKADGTCDTGYTKSNTAKVATGPSDVATNFDSHGTVTLMEATFNDDDVTADVASRDNMLFVYRPGGLSVGDHKLTLKVSDNAGNEKTSTLNFTVTERQAFKLDINPGANLVSLPGDPVDGGIDAVFGGDSGITTVVTFNNASGLWMTASRDGSGSFSGDLTMVDGDHAYWVVSNGAADLSVILVRSGGISTTPAAIPVVEGWNLVPVADAQQRKAGTGIDAQDYFANIDADVAYGYDSITGVMERLSVAADASDKDDMVKVGSGYWVYANKAGVIIP